jgi:hypothetical protein
VLPINHSHHTSNIKTASQRTHTNYHPVFFSSRFFNSLILSTRSESFPSLLLFGLSPLSHRQPLPPTLILIARLPCQVRFSTWHGACTCICTLVHLCHPSRVAAESRAVSSAETGECSSPTRKLFTGMKFHVFKPSFAGDEGEQVVDLIWVSRYRFVVLRVRVVCYMPRVPSVKDTLTGYSRPVPQAHCRTRTDE